MPDPKSLADRLAAPFAADEIRWKPQAVSGNRALAIPYLNARAVMDRLDEVLGVDGWEDSYELLPDGSAVCTLKLHVGGRTVTKQDVGAPSEQPDEGDRRKAAFSDALKRAAVKFGVGRYLYAVPKQWTDWDPHKKHFLKTPTLPASALPPKQPAPPSNGKAPAPLVDILAKLRAFDARLVHAGLCKPDECVAYVRDQGVKAGLATDILLWPQSAAALAEKAGREFESLKREGKAS